MKKEDIFKRSTTAPAQARTFDEMHPTDAHEEESDPYVAELIERGMHAIAELDPIVRETMRNDPEALAEWDEIMHMCDDLDADAPPAASDSQTS